MKQKIKTTFERMARIAMTLMLLLMTTTAWAGYKLSQAPMGFLDGCEGGRLGIHVWGWTCDPYYETQNLHIEQDCSAAQWSEVSNRNNWYLEERNKAEIHLYKDGTEVKVVTVSTDVARNDVVDHFNFYTSPRHYEIYEEKPASHATMSLIVYYLDPHVEYEYYKRLSNEMGYDTWIEVDEPGTYHVVVYGTNVQGTESYDKSTRLQGERDVTVANGYTISFDANTTDNVSNMPGTTYKSQVANSVTIPESTWNVKRKGYTFLGWNTEPNGDGTYYRPGTETDSPNADITLYAQWVRDSFFALDWYGDAYIDRTSTISSVDDWNDLATLVNNGYVHGKTINLANDIGDENNPITRCIGTARYPFDNHFNGNGHSIYVDINDSRHEGTAPFRCMGICSKWQDERYSANWKMWYGLSSWDRQIRMLKVKGTVRGGKYCSGLVGISKGVDAFLCAVQADVITNSTHCAGVIGNVESSETKIKCSVFSGSISGAIQQTGIFIGARKDDKVSTCYSCLSTGTVSGANIDFAPYSEVTYCFKTTNLGKQGTYTPYDPAAIISKMVVLSINGTAYYWSQDDDGSILPYHQVYIATASDWNNIATRIANGASFKGRQLILNNDITVGTMLGTEEHPFDGIFDGQNHRLTFNLTTAESGCAPFRYIKDAEIKRLKIGGTINQAGGKSRMAGIAAYASGSNNVSNCTVLSTLHTPGASFHHAGFVAQINGRVQFNNCAFKGRLICDADSYCCGGFVAINNGYGTSFNNCIFAPAECTMGTEDSNTITRDIKEFATLSEVYYTQELGKLQGTRVYTTAPDNMFSSLWRGPDNVNYYMPVPTYISGLQHTYNYNGGNPINIDYTFYCYQYLQDAEKYTATIRKSTEATEVTKVTEIGSYNLTITANEGSGYYGATERTFYVTASSLPMNDEGHFLINSANDWYTLCALAGLQEYNYFSNRIVELTADITVDQPLDIFCGTLAGNGHTLTFNYGTALHPVIADYAAPISCLRGNAIVENLHVNGTIITSTGRFAAGLVGTVGSQESAQHHVRINNCRSSIRIKSTYQGACHNGGFVGYAYNGKLAFNNCLFDGCFTSEDANHVKATHWAGFVGYKGDAEVRFNSCLYFSNIYEMSVPSDNNATFYLPADASSVSLQNCCHTESNWVNKQGKYVEDYYEASDIMAALGKEGWFIDFQSPQWQSSEGPARALVFPRYDYHTALPGNIKELEGSGTAADPYLIGSSHDWSVFATNINNNVGTDAYYQLTEDITINHGQKVGRVLTYFNVNDDIEEHRAFRGTFDGNGHTLTLDMWAGGECAPFAYAHDCTIKNLNIDGTISTSGQHVASLIVNASGTVNITGCRSSVTINSSVTGAGNNGGFVANSYGITNIEGCVFVGSILGEATYSCGGFVGSRNSGTVNITGSIFAPAAVTIALDNASDKSATFCRNNGATITNSYYTQPLHTSQGTALYTVTAAEGIDMSIGGDGVLKEYASGITMKGNGILLDGVFYAPKGASVPIEKLELITGYSPQDATIAPNAGTYADGTLTMPAQNVVFQTSTPIALSTYTIHFDANGGTGEAMANMDFTYGDAPKALTANNYTRAGNDFSGWNTKPNGSGTAYADGQTVENLTTVSGTTITLYAQWEPWIAEGFGKTDSYTPNGTADNPYIINTTEEWNLLCDYIGSNKGELASSHYRLGNHITVSRKLGTATNPFRGNFEGAACTLTLNLTGDDALHALAPFAYVNDATIKNLRTAGTINGDASYYAAGIVGKADGNTTLKSCYSSVTISSTATVAEGDEESQMLGGIVAQSTGSLHLTDCLFDGTINAENTSHCGGFLGQRVSGSVSFTNCLMDGKLNCNTNGCGTYYQADESDSDYTLANSYYHTAYGAGQGTQTGDTGESLKKRLGESWTLTDGDKVVPFINTYDLATGKLILSAVVYPYTGSPVTVGCTVRNFYNELLSENTDYTITIKNAEGTELTEVTELGEYALTINGTGDFVGSKSVHFCVYEPDGGAFPLQTDNDFQYDTDNEGYFFARMQRSDEDNPRIVNIPAGFTRCFYVYDDGGKLRTGVDEDGYETTLGYYEFGDYINPKTLTLTCPEGYCFSVQGTMNTAYCHPFTIYDGSSVGDGDVLLDQATGRRTISPFVTSGNGITFYLDATENWGIDIDGFDLSVQVVRPVPPTYLANDDSQMEESEKNTSVITANDGEEISVTLDGHTLYRDGTWNTLCLPFDIENISYTPLRGATVKALKSTSYSDGGLTVNFSQNLTSMEAGKPYIVKWTDMDIQYTSIDGTRDPYGIETNDYSRDFQNLLSNDETKCWIIEYKYQNTYHTAFCEFLTSEPMAVTGYTMKTGGDSYCPKKWTLKGKRYLDDSEWTLLDSRDVTETGNPEDVIPSYYDDPKIYNIAADKQGIYKYFRIDVEFNHVIILNGMQLFGTPVLDNIVNPTFRGVTIKDELHPVNSSYVTFTGSYSSLPDTDGLLLDAHNADGNAFHAALSLPDVNWYTDAEHTTPATGTAIPFADNGNATFYYKQNELGLTLHDDDSQAAENEKNANLIAAKDGELAVVTLDGRTLYKDGTWNTICLPFDLSEIKGTPLEGASVKAFTLENTEKKDGALTLNFSQDLTSLEAGKPYIVKWEYINFPTFDPSENQKKQLGIVNEIPTIDDSGLYHIGDRIVDGNLNSQLYGYYDYSNCVEFHYEEPITPTGYALWTANEWNGKYNPTHWTIMARNEGDERWTELVTVDNSAGDKLPMANSTCALFELNNTKAYKYFSFKANGYGNDDYYYQLSELQLFTGHPNIDIVNPVFAGVTIKSQTEAPNNIFFEGSYGTLASTDGQMLDAHNAGGKAFHAALSLSSLNSGSYDFNCYTDAEHTTPAGGAIPFNTRDGSVTLYPTWSLTLNNNDAQAAANEKNADIINEAINNPAVCDVTLSGRTLYKDGDWNTLCLPFNLGNPQAEEGHYFDGTLLEGATVMMLESTEFEDGVLKMNFVNVPMVVAGFPFIVKWEGDGSSNLVNPVFTGVTITNDASHIETDHVNFVGTYNSVVFDEGTVHKDVLLLGGGSSLYYPDGTAPTTVNACRAYFQLNGLTIGDANGVRAFSLNFGDEETTSIVEMRNEEGEMRNGNDEMKNAWYTLDGCRLNGKPTRPGMYIHNGIKVAIK